MMIERMLAAKEDEETDYWQEIETLAYCLDGKAPEDWHELLNRVAAQPYPAPSGHMTLEEFKRYAVCHLIEIFAGGPDLYVETDAEKEARYGRIFAAFVSRCRLLACPLMKSRPGK
jgi:hypothetical protein